MPLYLTLLLAGAAGAFIKDVIKDNKLILPKKINGELCLGFLGGILIGAVAGLVVDHSVLTAFLGGYSGTAIIENLVSKGLNQAQAKTKSVEDIIREIAKEESVDPDLAIRVARCESRLDQKAININLHLNADGTKPESYGSRDRGIFQINSFYHPEVTDEQALDPIFSTRFFCKAFKEGHLSWWNATKNCWDK